MKTHLNRKAAALCLLLLPLAACTDNAAAPDSTNSECLEGIILSGDISWNRHQGCYANSVWVSILNKKDAGRNVELITFANGTQKPVLLENMVEVLLPIELARSNRRDTLDNRKIFFRYRPANETEIPVARNTQRSCQETYQWYNVPILVPTAFSFNNCPSTLGK